MIEAAADAPSFVLLAGGLGRRFGGDKQVDPVGPRGEPLGAYTAFDALRAGFGEVVIVARPGAERAVHAAFRAALGPEAPLRVVPQSVVWPEDAPAPSRRTRPWGTAHAALAAAAHVPGPFGIANADDGYGPDALPALLESLVEAAPADVTLVTYEAGGVLSPHGGVSRGWVRESSDGHVEVIEVHELQADGSVLRGTTGGGEAVELSRDTPVSMNLWGLTSRAVVALEAGWHAFARRLGRPEVRELEVEYALSTALNGLARDGTVQLQPRAGGRDWFGMTFATDRPAVMERLATLHAEGVYPTDLTVA